MQQVVQSLKNGTSALVEVPCAQAGAGQVLIRSRATLISSGTERMLIEFGKAGWIDKARQQPDKVRQVLDKIRVDGLASTFESVRAKLDQPLAPGYSNAGVVIEAGAGAGFSPGDRVVSNGPHAEVVLVPRNLCARIPDGVSDETAAFAVVGAIALQGVRLARPELGETFAVMGLGLIGLLTVQLLRAQGCRVIGIDPNPGRMEFGRLFGAESAAAESTVDGVLVTAATKSAEPIHQAAQLCRKRGRIVLAGVTGLELSRDDFYKKELSFQVSCSYGPGRYDPEYEDKGHDYPLGFVRWTAQRNMAAVLGLMGEGKLDVSRLITHRFAFEQAGQAYDLLLSGAPHMGIVLGYPARPEAELRVRTVRVDHHPAPAAPADGIGVIGAGGYATKVLLPALARSGAKLASIASGRGLSAAHAARKFGFEEATTDAEALIARPDIGAVVIATRHDSHAKLASLALAAGKHVFVEKPLAIDYAQLVQVEKAASGAPGLLMVGFNRRFSPHARKAAELLAALEAPKAIVITVNAGAVPPDHWTLDARAGGGRIAGEACHFIDLARFLAGAPAKSVHTTRLDSESASIALEYMDGSTAVIHYLANGHRGFPKERIEVFCAGRILQIDNFRVLRGYGWPGFRKMKLWRQDKGNARCVAAFVEAIRDRRPSPIPRDELFEVARITLEAAQ